MEQQRGWWFIYLGGVTKVNSSYTVHQSHFHKEKRCVVAVGDCLPKGMQGLMCRLDPLLREACCLPGAQVKDMKRKPPTLDMALRFLAITDLSGRQCRSCTKKPKGNRETSGSWDDRSRDEEHKLWSLSIQLQGIMREKMGRANRFS